jgi:site-specific DNA-cytosine methylase
VYRVENVKVINSVDLFCGGGGLSLGFENSNEGLAFQTVLALDNDPAAVRCFNNNRPKAPGARIARARLCDITWFQHVAEIRLFYLVHLALTDGHNHFAASLNAAGLNIRGFLRAIGVADQTFGNRLGELSKLITREDRNAVDFSVLSLAITRSFFSGLGLRPAIPFSLNPTKLPWTEEAQYADVFSDAKDPLEVAVGDEFRRNAEQAWQRCVTKLATASAKVGKGINSKNSVRLQQLLPIFSGRVGALLQAAWCEWHASRHSIRAEFCLRNEDQIRELYRSNPVHLMLGGPPCKGFSRIGRPVIESLRSQGVHAWSDVDFGDERNALMCEYVLFLRAFAPDCFLFENVSNFKSVLRTPNGTLNAPEMLGELIEALSNDSLHYRIESSELNAKDFAVPQDRRRFLLAGRRRKKASGEEVSFEFFNFEKTSPLPISIALMGLSKPVEFDFNAETKPTLSIMRTAQKRSPLDTGGAENRYLDWIQPRDCAVGETYLVDSHLYRAGRDDDREFLKYVAPGVRWMDLKITQAPTLAEMHLVLKECERLSGVARDRSLKKRIGSLVKQTDSSLVLRLLLEEVTARSKLKRHHLLEEGYLAKGTGKHGDWFERLDFNKPCKTIVAHIGKDTYGFHHPFDRRPISIREAARIQSFPDRFSFAGIGVVDAYSIIGNAVPPLMASHLARRVSELDLQIGIFGQAIMPRPTNRRVPKRAA